MRVWLWIPFRKGSGCMSWEVAARSRGAMGFWDGGGKGEGGRGERELLQSALNSTDLCLCDCQVGHYWLIRALFSLCGSDWAEHAAPSHTPSQRNQAPLSPHCHFHCCDFKPSPPPGPNQRKPPPLQPTFPPAPRLLPLRLNEYPFTARRKGQAKLVMAIVNHARVGPIHRTKISIC